MNKNLKISLLFIALAFSYSTISFAECKCFSYNFVYSTFSDSPQVSCTIYSYKAMISDGKHSAVTNQLGCQTDADYYKVKKSFKDPYSSDNSECILVIKDACKALHVDTLKVVQ